MTHLFYSICSAKHDSDFKKEKIIVLCDSNKFPVFNTTLKIITKHTRNKLRSHINILFIWYLKYIFHLFSG